MSEPATAQNQGQEDDMHCQYCEHEAIATPADVEPLCQRHLELRAISWVLERQGRAVTPETVIAYLELITDPIALTEADVPELLKQIERRGLKKYREQQKEHDDE